MPFDRVEDAIQDIRDGKMVIVADDEDRENEGDLVCAASAVTPEIINFMAMHGRGLICLALTSERADELDLRPMSEFNTEAQGTAFTVSVDAAAKYGVTTGISAWDRAKTIEVCLDPDAKPADLRRPGHVFPLRARPGGVLRRVGQTEASVDLARLAGLPPAGVICEILNDDGTMARRPELEVFARRARPPLHHRGADRRVPAPARAAGARARRRPTSPPRAATGGSSPTATRWTSSSTWPWSRATWRTGRGDWCACTRSASRGTCSTPCAATAASSWTPPCGHIEEEGAGVIVYLRQEGRGIGLVHKLRAYALQDEGMDTVRGQRGAGLPARPARLRHRRADPARPGALLHPHPDQQPQEDRGAGRVRALGRGAGSPARGTEPAQPGVPATPSATSWATSSPPEGGERPNTERG